MGVIISVKHNGELLISNPDLKDYKWYCFNGKPRYCQVIQNRSNCETIDFFDVDWNHQGFVGLNPCVENADYEPAKPTNLEIQKNIAEVLSSGIPFVRVDLFENNGKVHFGEMTFFPANGTGGFRPNSWNLILGNMIHI